MSVSMSHGVVTEEEEQLHFQHGGSHPSDRRIGELSPEMQGGEQNELSLARDSRPGIEADEGEAKECPEEKDRENTTSRDLRGERCMISQDGEGKQRGDSREEKSQNPMEASGENVLKEDVNALVDETPHNERLSQTVNGNDVPFIPGSDIDLSELQRLPAGAFIDTKKSVVGLELKDLESISRMVEGAVKRLGQQIEQLKEKDDNALGIGQRATRSASMTASPPKALLTSRVDFMALGSIRKAFFPPNNPTPSMSLEFVESFNSILKDISRGISASSCKVRTRYLSRFQKSVQRLQHTLEYDLLSAKTNSTELLKAVKTSRETLADVMVSITTSGPNANRFKPLYCHCKSTFSILDPMLQCDSCHEWYHMRCELDTSPLLLSGALQLEQFRCSICIGEIQGQLKVGGGTVSKTSLLVSFDEGVMKELAAYATKSGFEHLFGPDPDELDSLPSLESKSEEAPKSRPTRKRSRLSKETSDDSKPTEKQTRIGTRSRSSISKQNKSEEEEKHITIDVSKTTSKISEDSDTDIDLKDTDRSQKIRPTSRSRGRAKIVSRGRPGRGRGRGRGPGRPRKIIDTKINEMSQEEDSTDIEDSTLLPTATVSAESVSKIIENSTSPPKKKRKLNSSTTSRGRGSRGGRRGQPSRGRRRGRTSRREALSQEENSKPVSDSESSDSSLSEDGEMTRFRQEFSLPLTLEEKCKIMCWESDAWHLSTIVQVSEESLLIHFDTWPRSFDEWIPKDSDRIAAVGSKPFSRKLRKTEMRMLQRVKRQIDGVESSETTSEVSNSDSNTDDERIVKKPEVLTGRSARAANRAARSESVEKSKPVKTASKKDMDQSIETSSAAPTESSN